MLGGGTLSDGVVRMLRQWRSGALFQTDVFDQQSDKKKSLKKKKKKLNVDFDNHHFEVIKRSAGPVLPQTRHLKSFNQTPQAWLKHGASSLDLSEPSRIRIVLVNAHTSVTAYQNIHCPHSLSHSLTHSLSQTHKINKRSHPAISRCV